MSAPTPPPYGESQPGQPPTYPSYANPPLYPAYQRPVPNRRRPSAWWFAIAGLLMVAGVAIGIFLIVRTVSGFLETDATIQVDGLPHEVTVPTDRDRMLWVDGSGAPPTCTILDTSDGTKIDLDSPSSTYTRGDDGIDDAWGRYTFEPGSGRLEVTCGPASSGVIEIGPAPEFGEFFGGLAAGILIPLLVGGGGFVLMILIAILYATGRPRNVPAPR